MPPLGLPHSGQKASPPDSLAPQNEQTSYLTYLRHDSQKSAPGSRSAPQFGQEVLPIGWPQEAQKAASGSLTVPQLGHFTPAAVFICICCSETMSSSGLKRCLWRCMSCSPFIGFCGLSVISSIICQFYLKVRCKVNKKMQTNKKNRRKFTFTTAFLCFLG